MASSANTDPVMHESEDFSYILCLYILPAWQLPQYNPMERHFPVTLPDKGSAAASHVSHRLPLLHKSYCLLS